MGANNEAEIVPIIGHPVLAILGQNMKLRVVLLPETLNIHNI